MKNIYLFPLLLSCIMIMTSCSKDSDNETIVDITKNVRGTYVDERDGNVYNYITIGGLDWMTDNCKYDLGDDELRAVYETQQIPGDYGVTTNAETIEKYGYLYSFSGAQQAAPEGWRVPTDEDWKSLEIALGMTKEEADGDEWRGNGVATIMNSETGMNMVYGGFIDLNSTSWASKSYFINAAGMYWTSTSPAEGLGYMRKILYKSNQVYRHTTKTNNKLSVRFVRDAE